MQMTVESSVARIIPTRVGTRIPNYSITTLLQDHPHACGDKIDKNTVYIGQMGSSPRVWGQAYAVKKAKRMLRIIPTRVGTSVCNVVPSSLQEDHPHACGDKLTKLAKYR